MLRSSAWLLLGALAACSANEAPNPTQSTAGSSGAATTAGAASGGSSGAGTAGTSTAGASAGTTSGTAGQGGTSGSAGSGGGASGGASAGTSGGGQAGEGQAGGGGGNVPELPKRVLLYHFSTLSIASVPAQLTLLKTQLQTWGFESEDSVDPASFSESNLKRFGAVAMVNTCFEPFGAGKMGNAETTALKAFVEGGGGLFGTHCASVTFQSADPPHAYNALLGGRGGKSNYNGKSACSTTEQHPTTTGLSTTFDYTGNLDNADYVAPDAKVLVKCLWSGGEQKETAVSWYRTPGKGRVFFTNFAKEDKDLSDATLGTKHILAGLSWVLGR